MSEQNPIDSPLPATLGPQEPAATQDSVMCPQVLSYEAPIDRLARKPQRKWIAISSAMLFSGAIGAGITLFAGVYVFISAVGVDEYPPRPNDERNAHIISAVALAGAVLFGFLIRRWIKNPSQRDISDFAALGLFIGVGAALLLLGVGTGLG